MFEMKKDDRMEQNHGVRIIPIEDYQTLQNQISPMATRHLANEKLLRQGMDIELICIKKSHSNLSDKIVKGGCYNNDRWVITLKCSCY
jgi:site-specific recombinase XerD